MNWKILLSLFIIFTIAGLLMFSPRGKQFKEKYLTDYISKTADLVKNVPEEITFKKVDPEDKFNILITTEQSTIDGYSFNINENNVEAEMIYESILLDGQQITTKNTDKVIFKADNMKGTVSFENGKIRISGASDSIEVNNIAFVSDNGPINFDVVGTPVSYNINGITKNSMKFSNIVGLITLGTWSPLSLQNDELEIQYFDGSLSLNEDVLSINGRAYKAKLNNVDLSLENK